MDFNYILSQPAFVIHIEELSPERTHFFTENIKNAGYTDMRVFRGVKARDPVELTESIKTFKYPVKINTTNNISQIGCMMSHLKVYKHIIDNNINVCTIFEDDVHFHPKWHTIASNYFNSTPKNYDVIFIGNWIENYKHAPKINNYPCLTTHAYIITLNGAKKLLSSILKWDYYNYKQRQLNGLHIIDTIIKNIQTRIKERKIKRLFNWYCWNGTKHSCPHNSMDHKYLKSNCGLVFQSENFKSTISKYA